MATKESYQKHRQQRLEYAKIYYRKNKDKVREWKKEYRSKNRSKIRDYQKKYKVLYGDRILLRERGSRLKREYGISLQEYDRLCELQNNVCAICLKRKGEEMLIVDHNHKTGKVRGLLCSDCNKGLGFFRDNSELLEKARVYLRS